MKTFLKLLAPLALAVAIRVPAADEPAASTPATNKPARAVPARVNLPPPVSSGSNATTAAVKPVVPAATSNAAPAAPSPQNKTPIANLPSFPAPGVTVRAAATNRTVNAAKPAGATGTSAGSNTATPAIPGAPQPATGARANVAGAPAPGANANAPAGAAAAADGKDDDILPAGMIKFQDADMMQVLEIYQELTGRTVLRPTSLPGTKISIKTQTDLTRAEAILALDSILSMNGVTMVPQGTKFVKAVAEAQAGNNAPKFSDVPFEDLPESGTYVTHIVQLTNATPNDVMQVLTPFSKAPNSILTIPSTGMIVLRDYAENVKRMLEMIAKVDVVPVQEFESVVIPIKYALAGDIAQVLGGLTAGGGSAMTIGSQRSNTGLSTGGGGFGGTSGGFGNNAGGLGNQGYGNQQGLNRLGGQTLGGGAAGGLGGGAAGRGSFANRLQQIANQSGQRGAGGGGAGDIFVLGNTKIIADERINALLIFASKTDLQTISNIIDKLDVVLAQVVIDAIVMQVSLNHNFNFGVSYVQTQPTMIGSTLLGGMGALNSKNVGFLGIENFTGGGSNSIPEGFSYAARFMDFDATVKAFASDGRTKILQRPRIQTSHAVEANLFVGETRPYPTGSSYGGFGGNYSSIQQLQIGLTLSVLPLINAEGLVVMDIRAKIQDIGADVPIQNIGNVPSTFDREANAKVAVRDGETVLLGGMLKGNKSNSKSGIPYLKDIPFLGALFRSSKSDDDRQELLVLIRPTVLPTPEAAANYAKDQRKTMPATSAASDEFDEAERKLAEAEEKRAEEMRKQEEKRKAKQLKKEGFSK